MFEAARHDSQDVLAELAQQLAELAEELRAPEVSGDRVASSRDRIRSLRDRMDEDGVAELASAVSEVLRVCDQASPPDFKHPASVSVLVDAVTGAESILQSMTPLEIDESLRGETSTVLDRLQDPDQSEGVRFRRVDLAPPPISGTTGGEDESPEPTADEVAGEAIDPGAALRQVSSEGGAGPDEATGEAAATAEDQADEPGAADEARPPASMSFVFPEELQQGTEPTSRDDADVTPAEESSSMSAEDLGELAGGEHSEPEAVVDAVDTQDAPTHDPSASLRVEADPGPSVQDEEPSTDAGDSEAAEVEALFGSTEADTEPSDVSRVSEVAPIGSTEEVDAAVSFDEQATVEEVEAQVGGHQLDAKAAERSGDENEPLTDASPSDDASQELSQDSASTLDDELDALDELIGEFEDRVDATVVSASAPEGGESSRDDVHEVSGSTSVSFETQETDAADAAGNSEEAAEEVDDVPEPAMIEDDVEEPAGAAGGVDNQDREAAVHGETHDGSPDEGVAEVEAIEDAGEFPEIESSQDVDDDAETLEVFHEEDQPLESDVVEDMADTALADSSTEEDEAETSEEINAAPIEPGPPDPNTPLDPNAALDPTGGFDPNVPLDPTGGLNPNVPLDPTGGLNPNVSLDPNTPLDPNASLHPTGGFDPNVALDPTGGAPGMPEEPAADEDQWGSTPIVLDSDRVELLQFLVTEVRQAVSELAPIISELGDFTSRPDAAKRLVTLSAELAKVGEFFEFRTFTRLLDLLTTLGKGLDTASDASMAELSLRLHAIGSLFDQFCSGLEVGMEMHWPLSTFERRIGLLLEGQALHPDFAAYHRGEVDRVLEVDRVIEGIEELPSPESETAAPGSAAATASAAGGGEPKEQTVRVARDAINELVSLVRQLVLNKNQFQSIAESSMSWGLTSAKTEPLKLRTSEYGRLIEQMQATLNDARTQPISAVIDRYERMVRDMAQVGEKSVDFRVRGGDVAMDKFVLDAIADPIGRLLRRTVSEEIETTTERRDAGKPECAALVVRATDHASHVTLEIEHDGPCPDLDDIRSTATDIAPPGFDVASLSEPKLAALPLRGWYPESSVAGVAEAIEAQGGSIDVLLHAGRTTVRISMPVEGAVMSMMYVEVAGASYAVPVNTIIEIVPEQACQLSTVKGDRVARVRDQVVPVIDCAERFNAPGPGSAKIAVVVSVGDASAALMVDRMLGQQEVVLEPLGLEADECGPFLGATILNDGTVGLAVDVRALIQAA